MVIRAFAPNRFRVLKGTADIPGFANAGSTCLPSVVVALQIVVEHFFISKYDQFTELPSSSLL
jgi:hypothetical protein